MTLLSGGSSVGVRDLTAKVFLSFPGAELLVHGVAVSPGKPFIWVRVGEHQLLGLPGQVASCVVAFHVLVEPILERLLGRAPSSLSRFGRASATLARNLPSAPGREEYVRVKLVANHYGLMAEPVFGKSGLLTTLIRGQGLVKIPVCTARGWTRAIRSPCSCSPRLIAGPVKTRGGAQGLCIQKDGSHEAKRIPEDAAS